MFTYLFIVKFRKPNGMVTCGDSATYPTVGGVQHCARASEGLLLVVMIRLAARRGARSFCTAKKQEDR